jgi:lipoprotein-anchoring transpeptidase ErfK/SrfK
VRLRKKKLDLTAIVKAKLTDGESDDSHTHSTAAGKLLKQKIPVRTRLWIISVFVVCLVGLPSFSTYAASQNRSQTDDVLLKPTPTPTATPSPIRFTIPVTEVYATPTEDTYFTDYTYHSWDIPDEITGGSTFWIEIDLTNQILYAYRGNQLISGFLVSTGTSSYRTVTGTYKIYAKYPAVTMIGPGYHLEDVPYTLFFYKGYAIHGTFWHNNFGRPMSHGCVNMATNEAAWVYDNAPVGTYVFVHY